MDAYFKDSLAHWLTVAEIAMFGGPDTMDNPGAPHSVFQAGEPSVEFLGTLKGIQRYSVSDRIPTFNNGREVEWSRCESLT